MKKSLLLMTAALFVACFIACEDEKEENKPFVGTWNSNIYPTVSGGDTILEKMSFEFTNSTFTDAISRSTGLTDFNLSVMVTIGGTVENTADTSISVSINTIELYNGASANRTQDETTFNTLFNPTVGAMLMTEFDAKFSLYSNDDSMKLFLPVKYMNTTVNQTIRLGKQE